MDDTNSSYASSWCLIESDPGVFTELVENVGVKGLEFEEIYSLDEFQDFLERNSKIYGWIFLFKWKNKVESVDSRPIDEQSQDLGLIFTKQVVENACATQAIVSILFNIMDEIDIGENLKQLKEFCLNFDPQMRGLCIGNCEKLQRAHNSFKQKLGLAAFKCDESDGEVEEAYHFIAYVPFFDKVYELDGLKEGPVLVGDCNTDQRRWEYWVKDEILRRVNLAGCNSDISYNLMALVESKLEKTKREIQHNLSLIQKGLSKLSNAGEEVPEIYYNRLQEYANTNEKENVNQQDDLPDDNLDLLKVIDDANFRVKILREKQIDEESKRLEWKKENIRRRFDFVPFILCVLREMARRGELISNYLNTLKYQN